LGYRRKLLETGILGLEKFPLSESTEREPERTLQNAKDEMNEKRITYNFGGLSQ